MFCWCICTALICAYFADTYSRTPARYSIYYTQRPKLWLSRKCSSSSRRCCCYTLSNVSSLLNLFHTTTKALTFENKYRWFAQVLLVQTLLRQLATQFTSHNDQSFDFWEPLALVRAGFAGTHSQMSARYSIHFTQRPKLWILRVCISDLRSFCWYTLSNVSSLLDLLTLLGCSICYIQD